MNVLITEIWNGYTVGGIIGMYIYDNSSYRDCVNYGVLSGNYVGDIFGEEQNGDSPT